MNTQQTLDNLLSCASAIYNREELETALASGQKLTVKLGADPSRPDLHLGHTVVLRQLAALQKLGHDIVFIIGDFTAMIGDPSGRSKTRPPLTFEETQANSASYFEQVTRILDPERTRIEYNSRWLGQMNFSQVLALAGKTTLARILERDDFSNRYAQNAPIGLHELLYPLMQAYDSVAIQADIEVGGTDQTFNLLMGRELQRDHGQKPQIVITFPLLVGLDGQEKMSKSLDNYIGISEEAPIMFEKCMKVPDSVLEDYFTLTCDIPRSLWEPLLASDKTAAHYLYAHTITAMYWDENAASEAESRYRAVAAGGLPETMASLQLPAKPISLIALVREAGFSLSNSEARRLITSGAIRINRIQQTNIDLVLEGSGELVLSRGKNRFVKVSFR